MTTILSLDLGTKTGWAIAEKDAMRIIKEKVYSGSECFQNDRFSGGGMRFLRFTKWLDELKALRNGIDEVYFEEVRNHAGTDAAHLYGGFMGHLTAWCEQYKIPYQGVPVGTIKKFATRRGNASKLDMIHAVERWGHKPFDDNEADALALLYWRIAQEKGAGIGTKKAPDNPIEEREHKGNKH